MHFYTGLVAILFLLTVSHSALSSAPLGEKNFPLSEKVSIWLETTANAQEATSHILQWAQEGGYGHDYHERIFQAMGELKRLKYSKSDAGKSTLREEQVLKHLQRATSSMYGAVQSYHYYNDKKEGGKQHPRARASTRGRYLAPKPPPEGYDDQGN